MSVFIISCIINCLTCATLVIFILATSFKKKISQLFLLISFSAFFFCLFQLFWQFAMNPEKAALFWKLFTLGLFFINISFINFTLAFLKLFKKKKKQLIIYHLINIIFIIINLNSFFYKDFKLKYELGFWPTTTIYFNVYIVFWLSSCLYGIYLFYQKMKEKKGVEKEQIKFFILGSLLGTIGGICHCLMLWGLDLSLFLGYLNLSISLYVGIMAYAIIKYRFLNIKIALSQTGIFLTIYTFIMGSTIYIALKTNFGLPALLYLFVISSLGSIIHQYLQKKTTSFLLTQQQKHHHILSQATQNFVKEYNLEKLSQLILNEIKDAMEINFAKILLLNEEKNYSALIKDSIFNITIPSHHPIINYLEQNNKAVFYKKINHLFQDNLEKQVSVIIPLTFAGKLLGIILLGSKKNSIPFSTDDLKILDILANQIALAIHNCFIIKKNKSDHEQLLKIEKFSFIGEIAEGLAKQIKNNLNYFSLASAEIQLDLNDFLESSKKNNRAIPLSPSFIKSLKEISQYLIDNVKRTDAILRGILNYSKIKEIPNYITNISFDEVINGAIDLARIKHDIEKIDLKINIESSNIICGVKIQLLEVFYTLISNSCEALEEKKSNYKLKKSFQPIIEINLNQKENLSLITIKDNGIGIKNKDHHKIFAPYFSTKSSEKTSTSSELGIGLYTVHKVITEVHKGDISFESKYLEGTTFKINLPKKPLKNDHF